MVDDSGDSHSILENDAVGSPRENTIDDEAFPTLENQRNIITQLVNENQENAKEGDSVYIIPQFWYANFFDPQTIDPTQLGPIDTALICRDYRNFILVEYDKCPYISIPEPVFVKLVNWYGLANDSQPVSTHLVYDENHNLITEYNQCVFRVHHLVESDQDRRHGGGLNKRVSYFAISRLCTVKQLSIKILDTFFERESDLDVSKAKFKIWFVKYSEQVGSNSILNSSFKLDPLQFMELPLHRRITPLLFHHTLKEVDILTGDFVVELRQYNKNYHWLSNYFMYNQLTPSSGITGLYNLGNTCYMNSALQCLVHIPELRDYFLYNCFEDEINCNNPLGYQGYVARAFSGLVQNLFGCKTLSSGSTLTPAYSPTGFKSTIGHFNSMFSGYMQQDSQEFITFLLDGLHEDLNRIVDKPYIEKPSLSPEDDSNDFNVIKRLAEDTWKLHLQRNDSVITDLFVGLYESTLQCPECNNVSITFDPYNDLTLPLPVNTVWHCKVKVFPQNSPPCVLEVEMGKSSTYQNLKEYVAKYANIEPRNLYGCEIFSHQFYNNYESPESNSQFLPIQELISESDDVIFYEIVASQNDTIVPILNSRIEEGFKNPRLFGVPFFIVLSPEERVNPGAIRYKLEKYFSHLSGGFVEFPSLSEMENHSLPTLPLLREKYPEYTFDEYQEFLKYAVKEDIGTIDTHFKIKTIEETTTENEDDPNQQILPDNANQLPRFWTPYSPINVNRAKDISESLNPVVRDIYDYPSLLQAAKGPTMDDNGSNEQKDKVSDLQTEPTTAQDSDIDLENAQEEQQDENSVDSEPNEATTQNTNDNNDNQIIPLVNSQTFIVCEWSESAIQEVFSEDKLINWEKPAELKNTQLEVERQKRQQEEEKKITLHDCLKLFSKREVLGMNDSWYCPSCKEHRQATKQIQLWDTPDVLLIHLKRFENLRSFSDKIDEVVHFPITGLDMSPYLVNKGDPRGTIYDLVAVDNHYGGLGGGHYTAYAKNVDDSKWYYFDDSRVTETTPERGIASSAYLLFYVRRTADGKCGTHELQELIQKSRKNYDDRIRQMYDRQRMLFESNKTDSEEIADIEEDSSKIEQPREEDTPDGRVDSGDSGDSSEANGSTSSHENSVSARSADYSVRSLEVGRLQPRESLDENENNMSRRKLRILNKTYNEPSIAHSPASSVSSDGTDSISAALSQAKSGNDNILRSPTKD
ncbi:hypothetical protein ZYGR_0I07580 [Zygosaccharomyces rouxii]|uniref:ubiquitinyl hydrolase 1 n=2 Tax=Zygosaccharomyces rouxii TaxID=4956 RepID=C5DUM2_ZYGRC|nr:uncharacterized protein ZYRO0C17908g [Zygosaccharomyces rouxii]KAH9201346.1 ubiquitin carboxyl-terminal hydrolase 12 [Zygosaccharomyces rouxii]GAV48461.1 hypothetical protein ZYGR_0I07580 [Zygosaccharomyces rouxii]CAQ43553.1 Ubiquitin carboxyl-terminal hydrolase 12 [Zygosaccharomyces rouxii]CAR27483.1 ZYRO0C17908p [Zygosaccharomyces rouxii]